MKTKLLIMLVTGILLFPSIGLAHKPLLTVEDNGDGTIYIETGFSDGSSGAGHKILLRAKDGGKILFEGKVPEEGYLEEVPMPNVPYTVTFNAGPGHVAVKDGPFSEETAASAETETAEKPDSATTSAAPAEGAQAPSPAQTVQTSAAPAAPQQTAPVVSQPVVQTNPSVAQPAVVVAQPMPSVQQPVAAASFGPGATMAFKMSIMSQMITAIGVLAVIGAVMFIMGYIIGKDAKQTK